jgi:hypothetical protein
VNTKATLVAPVLALLLAADAQASVVTNSFSFTYTNRAALLADGWDFLARSTNGAVRNTETTNGITPPDVSYDQNTHPGVLRVPIYYGDLYSGNNSTRNTLFHDLATNWMSLRLETAVQPTQNYQGVHLAMYQDDDNFVEVAFGYGNGQTLFLSQEVKGVPATLKYLAADATNSPSLHLRLDREFFRGDVSAYYSLDGTNWAFLGWASQTLTNARLAICTGGAYGSFPNADLLRVDILNTNAPITTSLVMQPAGLAFGCVAGQSCTNRQQARLINRGPTGLAWNCASTAPWLFASPTNGPATGVQSGTCDVWVDPTGLTPGLYQAALVFNAPGAANSPAALNVSLIVNPAGRTQVATWRGGKRAALSVSVDDGQASMFSVLTNYGFKGSYVMGGTNAPAFFNNYYLAGMELGPHLIDHTCNPFDEPTMRYEIGANIAALCATTIQPCDQVLTLIWPCGFCDTRMKVVSADYVLCARGYGINLLEDRTPYDFMNLKSFNSHGQGLDTTTDLNPTPTNFVNVIKDALAQGKWANLSFHGANDDDGAVAYAAATNVWVARISTVVKYIMQRDRTVLSNYVETAGLIQFDCFRLPLPPSDLRSYEAIISPQDPITLQVDVSGIQQILGFSVDGSPTTNYSFRTAGSSTFLLFDTPVTVLPQRVQVLTSTNHPPSLAPIADRAVHALVTLSITNSVSDADLPGQLMTFSVDPPVPAGAVVGPADGVLVWTPAESQVGTNQFTVRVTDNGLPALNDSKTFFVNVLPRPTLWSAPTGSNAATVAWSAIPGTTYRLQFKTNLNDAAWTDWMPDIVATGITATVANVVVSNASCFYRVRVQP